MKMAIIWILSSVHLIDTFRSNSNSDGGWIIYHRTIIMLCINSS